MSHVKAVLYLLLQTQTSHSARDHHGLDTLASFYCSLPACWFLQVCQVWVHMALSMPSLSTASGQVLSPLLCVRSLTIICNYVFMLALLILIFSSQLQVPLGHDHLLKMFRIIITLYDFWIEFNKFSKFFE